MAQTRSRADWEEWCLDEFFLKPGQDGPIEYIEIVDQDVLDFLGIEDLELASRIFSRALGLKYDVREMLSDPSPPRSGREPPSIRLLVFVCWAQVTSLLPAVEHDFRDILTFRLGWSAPSNLIGLRHLWVHLSDWLRDRHNVELRLPVGNYVQIGYATRLPFPTWRDLGFLRSVRDSLPVASLDKPRVVADRIRTIGLEGRSPSFKCFFDDWNLSARVADLAIAERLFDRAWTRVVSEIVGSAELYVLRDEFGRYLLEIVEQGRTRSVAALADVEILKLKPAVGRLVRAGAVPLTPIGFGRWLASEDRESDALLYRIQPAAGLDHASLASAYAPVRIGLTGWMFQRVVGGLTVPQTVRASGPAVARRRAGIRVGAALLGRAPMTPEWLLEGAASPTVTVDGTGVPAVRDCKVLHFPAGTWTGQVQLMDGSARLDAFRLVSDAIEHQSAALKIFDAAFALAEDGDLRDTEPDDRLKTVAYRGARVPQCESMLALEEAVYARSGRSIAMTAIVDLAKRAAWAAGGPSPWDMVRSFVDGGWLEPAAVRAASGRLFVPRAPCLIPRLEAGREIFVLDGMAANAARSRIRDCAGLEDLHVEVAPGLGPWSLPLVVLRPGPTCDLERFLARSGLTIRRRGAAPSPRSRRWHSTMSSTIGFAEASVWDGQRGHFIDGAVAGGRTLLRRFDRPALDQPSIYVLDTPAGREIFRSPVLALLRHAEATGRDAFRRTGPRLVRAHPRALLPAAWGRWLSRRALACAGPVRVPSGWTYAYPVDDSAQATLTRLCGFVRSDVLPLWCAAVSAANRDDGPSAVMAGKLVGGRLGSPQRRST